MKNEMVNLDMIANRRKAHLAQSEDDINFDPNAPTVESQGRVFKNLLGREALGALVPFDARKAITTDLEELLRFTPEVRTIPAFQQAGPRAELRFDLDRDRAAIAVLGGPVPGLRNLINGIVERHYRYFQHGKVRSGRIYGVYNGLQGLSDIANNTIDLNPQITNDWLAKEGSIAGIEQNRERLEQALLPDTTGVVTTNLKNNLIKILYVIGDQAALDFAHKLALANPDCSILGIPATVDDDIAWTDTPMSLSTVVEESSRLIGPLHTTAEAERQICLVELFGSVSVTGAVVLASQHVDMAILPEVIRPLSDDKAAKYLSDTVRHIEHRVNATDKPHMLIIIAEGVARALAEKGITQYEVERSQYKLEESDSFADYLGKILASNVSDARGRPMSISVNRPRSQVLAAPAHALDQFYCEYLGSLAVDSALAGYTDCMISKWLSAYVLVPLRFVVEKTIRGYTPKDYPFVDARFVNSETLRLKIPLPARLTVGDITKNILDILNAVEFLYALFALLEAGPGEVIAPLLSELRKQDKPAKNASSLRPLLATANREPLRISAMHYGSPVSLDLLGIGKVLEVIRDLIKDAAWRGRHEKELAELERKGRQVELIENRLLHEKTSVEIAAQKVQLDKARLENEKLRLEIAAQKLEMIQKTKELLLTDDDKKLVLSVITAQLAVIVDNPRLQ